MTSLINIPSEMRKRINDRLYTTKLCIKHCGMANPGPADIRKFKESWKRQYICAISSISKAQKVLKEQECPPLLYDIRTTNWNWSEPEHMPEWNDLETRRYIMFFEEEDYILFKLLYNNA